MTGSVLHVVGPSAGGIRRHVATLATGLEERGWEVRVAAPAGVFDGLRDDVAEVPISLGRSAPGAALDLRRIGREADVVHAHGLTAGWTAVLAGLSPRLVVTVHNLVLDEAAGRAARALRFLEGRLPARAQRTIVISRDMRRRFDPEEHDDRFVVIPPVGPRPNPTRTPAEVRAELGIDEHRPLVVLVGRLHPQKDVASLLEAVSRLDPAVHVAIVGDGPERRALAARTRSLHLDGRVAFLGARDDAADFQAAADVVVQCSIWEGYGLAVSEALALARPVVATAVGPVPELVVDGRTGRLVPPSDPGALAAAIADLLADPEGARELGRAGAKLVAPSFDHELLIRRTEDVYRPVIHEVLP